MTNEEIHEMAKMTLIHALNESAASAIKEAIQEGDLFGALEVAIIADDKIPRVNKESLLRRIAWMEVEVYDLRGLIKVGSTTTMAYNDLMTQILAQLDKTQTRLDALDADAVALVAKIPDPVKAVFLREDENE